MNGRPARVLIVEDEAVIAMELEDRVAGLGHEVCGWVLRAEEVEARVRATSPDVVLMDIYLGGGPAGIAVALRLESEHQIPVVFLSAHPAAELPPPLRSCGFLGKPLRPRELARQLEAALGRRPSGPA